MGVIQFPDLTEMYYSHQSREHSSDTIQTEFAFYLQGPNCVNPTLQTVGFTPVSIMNNWWPSHAGEIRPLTLHWMRATKENPRLQAVERKQWRYSSKDCYKALEVHMAGSGCGLKIGELPFKKSLFHKYFTLMRLPVEVTPLQKRWLTKYNFRHLDTGKLASYYVNGWKPEEYSTAKEFEYFKTTKEEWKEHGMDGFDQ